MRDLLTLPKADLHCHLEGSARPATINELADKYGMQVGDTQNFHDLFTFLDRYDDARSVICSIEDLERIAVEFIEDQVVSGSVYCEPDWAPHFYTDLSGLDSQDEDQKIEEVFTRVNRAMIAASRRTGVEFGHSIGARRGDPVLAVKIAHFAVAHRRDNVVSFGYAGDEIKGPHGPLRPAARIITESGLIFVPHAGEVLGADSVAEAIDMGANRIAHGVRSVEDESVARSLAERNIACDVTLTSNIRLGIYKDLASHPLRQMISLGIPVTLNTDDSLFFGASLLDEYAAARNLGLDDSSLAQIAKNSIVFSGLSQASITKFTKQIDGWLAIG